MFAFGPKYLMTDAWLTKTRDRPGDEERRHEAEQDVLAGVVLEHQEGLEPTQPHALGAPRHEVRGQEECNQSGAEIPFLAVHAQTLDAAFLSSSAI